MRISELKKMILEQVQAGQPGIDEPVTMDRATSKTRLSKDSVDDQIDSFILKFERESIVSPESLVMESLAGMNLSALLFEQDEEEGEKDLGAEDSASSTDVVVDQAIETVKKPPMDVDAFAKRIARLALGYRNQLDIPTVILNRSLNFLKENYDESYVSQVMDILDNQFDFNLRPEREPVSPLSGGRSSGLGAIGEPGGLPETPSD